MERSTEVGLFEAFVRSGNVYLGDSKMYYVGNGLYGWSCTTTFSTGVYALGAYPSEVYSSINYGPWYGLPLRCLYPV